MASSAARSSTPERVLTSFFKDVRALTDSAGEISRVSHIVLRDHKGRATSYLRDLQKLERMIAELKSQLTQDADLRPSAQRAQARAAEPSVQDAPGAVRSKLEEMIANREVLPSAEFLHELGLTKQGLSKAVSTNRIFYVDYRGDRYFPAFYVDLAYQRSQLEEVTKQLGSLPGGSKLQFFMNRKGSLNGATPLEALAQGNLQKVRDVAAAFAEQR